VAKDVKTVRPLESCPWCGTADRTPRGTCRGCGRYYLPQGWAREPRRRHIWWWLVAALALFMMLGTWVAYPFLPGLNIILLKRPTTQLTSDSAADQWAMHGLNLSQNRYLATPSRHPAGRLAWSVDLGPPTNSAPVVVDGVVYIGGHFRILVLDDHTGGLLRDIPTTGPVHTSVAIAGDSLYVGLPDWRVLALDRHTGETRWVFTTRNPITGAAAVAAGIVYISSGDGILYALDAATGRRLWSFQTVGYPLSPPAMANGLLFLGSTEGVLYALHAKTGQLRLRFRVPERIQDIPVIDNGLVYFPSGGQLYAVDASAREYPGQRPFNLVWAQFWLWQVPGVPPPPVQPGGLWRFSHRHRPRAILASPAVAREALYGGDLNGYLYARHARQATAVWQFPAEGGVRTSPLILGSRIYFGTDAGMLYALDTAQGTRLWQLDLGAPVETAPVFASGRLYIRTGNGWLHAIE